MLYAHTPVFLGLLPVPMYFPNLLNLLPSFPLYPFPSNSLPYLLPLPPYVSTSPSPLSRRGTVGLTQLHAELLQSQARTKRPLSRAETYNVCRLWLRWRWSHEVAQQLITPVHPAAATSVLVVESRRRGGTHLHACTMEFLQPVYIPKNVWMDKKLLGV